MMNLDIICAFVKKHGKDLGELVESNAKKGDKQALSVVLESLKNIRVQDMQDMGERGIYHDDFPDEEIGIDGYSITDMIFYVEDLIKQQPTGGGKRKSHKSHKSRKSRKSRKTRKSRKSRIATKKTRKTTIRKRVKHR